MANLVVKQVAPQEDYDYLVLLVTDIPDHLLPRVREHLTGQRQVEVAGAVEAVEWYGRRTTLRDLLQAYLDDDLQSVRGWVNADPESYPFQTKLDAIYLCMTRAREAYRLLREMVKGW